MEPYNIPKLAQSYKKGTFQCFDMTVAGFRSKPGLRTQFIRLIISHLKNNLPTLPVYQAGKVSMPDLFGKPLFNILNSNSDYLLNFDFCNVKVPLQAQALHLFADITLLCFFHLIQFNEIFSKITFRPF